ncbi:MAG: DUF4954 domain-containing protein [Candidatus Marinimicrobia bacterium CG08_land_8_20_14_0_20_45_22]|nr:MAG: DUF4954 domain-containing protein [Candidatus Marinimicrobia bacterium CG08_land_8_20_14_0_20_45_22]
MKVRPLIKGEIDLLIANGCSADNWNSVTIAEPLITERFRNVRFSGTVSIGKQDGTIESEKNVFRTCGIYDSFVKDCQISDHVFISSVKSLVNQQIGNDVIIENVAEIINIGETTFGNGTQVETINEGGGRTIPIFDRMTSQIAYLLATYRNDSEFIKALEEIIHEYIQTRKSKVGIVENGVRIRHCQIIRNVRFGQYSVAIGATFLEDGTIQGCFADPAIVGEGVVAKHFITLSGSHVDGGAILDRCFVGQGVKIGKQYSAENSVFFANCEAFHGEACSVFAGPYTVTHHKSTLLIAGMFSFFNAGSGTNQSNHMYKLGPLHQGILERGSKTGSFSYLLWPSKIGAYSVVIGKHFSNIDAGDFPFSYIIEEKGRSLLIPAINFFTVGTRRDAEKWLKRDRRKDPNKMDLIRFDFLSPFIIEKILNAVDVLSNLRESAQKTQETVSYKGLQIKRLLIKGYTQYYEIALKNAFYGEIVRRLEKLPGTMTIDEMHKALAFDDDIKNESWRDISGMIATDTSILKFMDEIRTGKISSVESVLKRLQEIHQEYEKTAGDWFLSKLEQRLGVEISQILPDQIAQIITDWKESRLKLNNMILKDTEKEFDLDSHIGYGLDGGPEIRQLDFDAVRGTFDDNSFVRNIRQESENVTLLSDKLIARVRKDNR